MASGNTMYVIRDTIWQTLEQSHIVRIFAERVEFLRLKDIAQLGPVGYIYPQATYHSRYNHSLGVAHLAHKAARACQKNAPELKISDDEVICVETKNKNVNLSLFYSSNPIVLRINFILLFFN